MSFVAREIELTFRLHDGGLNDQGQDTVSLRGHRVELILAQSGGILTLGELQLRIFGMKMADMNKFSTNQLHALAVRGADISVSAGDSLKGIKKIFDGTIIAGVVNYSGAPDVAFDLNARPGYLFQIAPSAANSYEGSADVATIVEAMAKQMGYGFENHGVSVQLSNPNLPGTLIQQLKSVCNAARVICKIENGIISIWPNGAAFGEDFLEVSPSAGLVGYPVFTNTGIQIVTEFNPEAALGRRVRLDSSVEKARGDWVIHSMRHELSTLYPQGPWFTTMRLAKEGLALNVSKW